MALDRAPEEPLREVLAEVEGLRVQIVTIGPGQRVRWHEHTAAADTIVAVVGSIVVETTAPSARHRLEPGERMTIPAGTAHTVSGGGEAACRFLNIHSGGAYDFRPLSDVA
jgi:quercetin dioxygenase-like cupin family protein